MQGAFGIRHRSNLDEHSLYDLITSISLSASTGKIELLSIVKYRACNPGYIQTLSGWKLLRLAKMNAVDAYFHKFYKLPHHS